jgi:hypothetical protein
MLQESESMDATPGRGDAVDGEVMTLTREAPGLEYLRREVAKHPESSLGYPGGPRAQIAR